MARKVVVLTLALGVLACAALASRRFGDTATRGSTPGGEHRDDTPGLVLAGDRTSSTGAAPTQSHPGQWGDIPDLIVVAERVSSVTTAYTQSDRGKWGDIPDQIVIGTAPPEAEHPMTNALDRSREGAGIVVTLAADTRSTNEVPVAGPPPGDARSRP